jgi:ribosomal protein S18 acetylase RimI-like enzyme
VDELGSGLSARSLEVTISIAKLETVAALGWRAPEQERLGDWLLRSAAGFTGRANSALATGSPGLPLAGAVDRVRGWYALRDLTAMIAVPYPVSGPDGNPVDRFLGESGWSIRSGAAMVMTAAPDAVAGHVTRSGAEVLVDPEPDDEWLAMYHYRGQRLPPVARRLLMSAPWQGFGSVREGGRVTAIGRVAVAAGWAGLTAIEVHPEHRRRGLATAVTAALAARAAEHGAVGLYLQVEQDNTAARALYRRAGFTDHHGYHYRVAPA